MLKAKKSLSQNFLIDKNICKKIINLTEIENSDILEIGPGYGFLTDIILSKKPNKIILIEKDIYLRKFLTNKYKKNKKVFIEGNNILEYDLKKLKNLIIISNLPYNISTKVILYLFSFNQNITEMILMIQKEVAQKFDYNLPKMNKYKFYTKISSKYSRCFDVSSNVFTPKPKVKSTVVKFILKKKELDFNKIKNFCNLIFKNVRKQIHNNININKNNQLSNKRVNELSIEELLKIYNFF